MKPLTQTALLRRRCQRILAEQKRRAARDDADMDYSLDELLQLAMLCPLCAYCRMPVSMGFSFDHLVPIARGGPHSLVNLCVVCQPCNVRKGRLTCEEYRQLLALVGSWPPAAQEDLRRRLMAGNRLYARNRGKKG
jgi:5-methylcytosine-specific restriction endonuclease McrA